jgi:CO/xanthine dehydrogenase Mo-binding subunit
VVEGHFETPFIEHAYLEPEAGVAYWDGDVLTLRVPAQSPFEMRFQMAMAMALAEEKVRIIVTPIGGGFGSKFDGTVEPLLALAACSTGRSVKMTLTREESLKRSTKRHAYKMDYRVGPNKGGKILAVDARLISDAGAYTDLSPRTIDQACIFACGPYEVPHLRVEGWAVYTNNVKGGAFRGFGINQAAFSLESALDEAARRLSLDPFDLRYKNALKKGSKTASGQILKDSVALEETIVAARSALERELPEIQQMVTPGCKLGIGMASAFKNVGAGKGKVDDAGATFTLLPGGRVELRVSAVDYGQGIRTTMAQITREVVPLGEHSLEVISGDTALTHKHGGAIAERQTLINGRAVQEPAKLFKAELLAKASSLLELPVEELTLITDVISSPVSDDRLTFSELEQELGLRKETVRSTYVFVAPKTFALADVEGHRSVPQEEYATFPRMPTLPRHVRWRWTPKPERSKCSGFSQPTMWGALSTRRRSRDRSRGAASWRRDTPEAKTSRWSRVCPKPGPTTTTRCPQSWTHRWSAR